MSTDEIPDRLRRLAEAHRGGRSADPEAEVDRLLAGFTEDVIAAFSDEDVSIEKAIRVLFGAIAFADSMERPAFHHELMLDIARYVLSLDPAERERVSARAAQATALGDRWSSI